MAALAAAFLIGGPFAAVPVGNAWRKQFASRLRVGLRLNIDSSHITAAVEHKRSSLARTFVRPNSPDFDAA